MTAFRSAVFVVTGTVAFVIGVVLSDAIRHDSFFEKNGRDVREFYCAGRAVAQRADPYRVEPLRSCVRQIEPRTDPAWAVTPAPLPGYDLFVAAGFATLPFGIARIAYELALVASVLVASLALARATRYPPPAVLAVLAPTVGFLNLAYGEPTPPIVAALAVGAVALERGRIVLPACCVGIAMAEPHVGLPAMLALAIAVPQTRVWVAAVATLLAGASVAAVGVGGNVEYVRSVLPLQALAEVAANDQYSLTHLLAVARVAPTVAVALGSLSYVVTVVVGVTLAVRLARGRRLAYVLLVPPAAVVLGGTYVHDVEIAVALPSALLLSADVPRLRAWCAAAAALLLLPATSYRLPSFPISGIAALVALIVLGTIVARGRAPRERRFIACAQALVVAIVVSWTWVGVRRARVAPPSPPIAVAAPVVEANDFAAVAWGRYLRSNGESTKPSPRYIVEKMPAWFALVVLLIVAAQSTRRNATGRRSSIAGARVAVSAGSQT